MSRLDSNGERPPEIGMLMDESATPARHRIARPQELPPLAPDESGRPLAATSDGDERGDEDRLRDKAVSLDESRPD